jgi:hypothetical protein
MERLTMENMNYPVTFAWVKPVSGYEWEDCDVVYNGIFSRKNSVEIPNGPYLVEKDISQDVELLKPFEDTALFANFSDIEASAASFEIWAGTYGMLTRGEKTSSGRLLVLSKNALALGEASPYGVLITLPDGRCGRLQCSESQALWFKEHRELSFAVMVWELAVNNDTKRLGKILQWFIEKRGVRVNYVKKNSLDELDIKKLDNPDYQAKHTFGSEVLFDGGIIRPWASTLYRYPDVVKPALLYVQKTINEKLQEYPVNIVLQLDEQGKLHKKFQPTNLLAAMWYQFHLVVAGEEKMRRCAICGKWESMKGHRDTWRKHALCASNARVQRFRVKAHDERGAC